MKAVKGNFAEAACQVWQLAGTCGNTASTPVQTHRGAIDCNLPKKVKGLALSIDASPCLFQEKTGKSGAFVVLTQKTRLIAERGIFMSAQNSAPKKKKIKFPHPVVLMFSLVLILSVLSWIIPAGQYEMVLDPNSNRMVVDPNSYTVVEKNPITPFKFLMSFPEGMTAAAEITFFIMITGAAFSIITATGAINAGIARLASVARNMEYLMIPLVVLVFSIGGATFGMSEENIVFVPIGIALATALGFDAMVGTAIVVMGAAVGFCAGFMNPFTIGVAQSIAELPMFSGLVYRGIIWAVLWIITSLFIVLYAKKVKQDPTKSILYGENVQRDNVDLANIPAMTLRQKLVLLTVAAGLVLLVFGVVLWGWYIMEIAGLFLGMGIIAGIIYGYNATEICNRLLDGVTDIATGAIMCGIARAILFVMEESMIKDTIIHAMANAISFLPKSIAVMGMYLVQLAVNFLIPSGSGQAAATMPIMTPIADVLDINRQVAVLCFQFGDGFTNNILPVSGTLMAVLSVAKISYENWLKFVGKLVLIWIAVGAVFVLLANAFNYGPF